MRSIKSLFLIFVLVVTACAQAPALQQDLAQVQKATESSQSAADKLQDSLDIAKAAFAVVSPQAKTLCASATTPTCVAVMRDVGTAQNSLEAAQAALDTYQHDATNFGNVLDAVAKAVDEVVRLKNLIGAAQ